VPADRARAHEALQRVSHHPQHHQAQAPLTKPTNAVTTAKPAAASKPEATWIPFVAQQRAGAGIALNKSYRPGWTP
jgi:hypothetical protein